MRGRGGKESGNKYRGSYLNGKREVVVIENKKGYQKERKIGNGF